MAGDAFEAQLSGDQEVPPFFTETTGQVRVVFDDAEESATFELEVNDGVRITQAHIHCGPADGNGPVVAFLAGSHSAGWDVDGVWVSNATITDDNIAPTDGQGPCPEIILDIQGLADAIRAGNAYVNVHSIANPAGEVRGQLAPTDDADDDETVCICHRPPGNPGNAHTICIAAAAVDAHLAHGDSNAPCENEDSPPRSRKIRQAN